MYGAWVLEEVVEEVVRNISSLEPFLRRYLFWNFHAYSLHISGFVIVMYIRTYVHSSKKQDENSFSEKGKWYRYRTKYVFQLSSYFSLKKNIFTSS